MTYAAWWFPILIGWAGHWLWTRRHAPWLDDPEPSERIPPDPRFELRAVRFVPRPPYDWSAE